MNDDSDILISRQDALDAIGKCTDIYLSNLPVMVDKAEAYKALNEVPFVEQIRRENHNERNSQRT